jgi:hypothetical protein
MTLFERRRAPRFNLLFTGTVSGETEQLKKCRQLAATSNVSAHGSYLLANTCPSVGDRIKLTLQWPFGLKQRKTAFETVGSVLRVDSLSERMCGLGVQFDDVLDLDPS